MSYFVDILSGVKNIFLPGYSQIFPLLNIRFMSILNYIKVQFEEGNPLINSIDNEHIVAIASNNLGEA